MECKTGYKESNGQCIKKKGLFRGSSKSYNPFKMWGSYAGVIVLIIIALMFFGLGSFDKPFHSTFRMQDLGQGSCLEKFLIDHPTISINDIIGEPSEVVSDSSNILNKQCIILYNNPSTHNFQYYLLQIVPMLLVGFLIGWGIHSLFRRFK